MAATKIERRVYTLESFQLFGVCLTALGQLRATIERHDVERGTIVATFGAGPLGTPSELSVALLPLDDGRIEMVATWRAGRRGGDRRLLAAFLASVDVLAARQPGH
jgi:hypothetical protein